MKLKNDCLSTYLFLDEH